MSTRGRNPFFVVFSLLLLLTVVFGFLGNLLLHSDTLPPLRPILHVHAVSLGIWYLLFFTQTLLIRSDRRALHQTLGALSLVLVLIMLPSGLYVSWEHAQRTGSNLILTTSIINVSMFILYYAMALGLRRRAQWHKRLMAFAALSLMVPAFARWTYIFDTSPFLVLPIWLLFALSVLAGDLLHHRKVIRATWFCLLGVVIHIGLLLTFSGPPETESTEASAFIHRSAVPVSMTEVLTRT